MKVFYLIVTLIFLYSCKERPQLNKTLLKTVWVSDSLRTENKDRWREFLFIDSIGNFTRCTWWDTTYILAKGQVEGSNLVAIKGETFQMKTIDSFVLAITSNNYYGRFHKSEFYSESFRDELLGFTIGEENREKLLGKWDLNRYEIEEDTLFSRRFLEKMTGNEFLGVQLKRMKLQLTKDGKLLASSGNISQRYRFFIDGNELNLSKDDYSMEMKMWFLADTLVINDVRGGIAKRRFYFSKA